MLIYYMSSAKREFVISLPPMLTVPSWSSNASVIIRSKSILKRVWRAGSLYSDCGSKPFSYGVIGVDCTGGLVIEAFCCLDQVGIDVLQLYGSP